MKNWGGHFTPELGGHFELESGGHFKLELGGQYHRNMHFESVNENVVTAVHAGIGAGTGAIGTIAFGAIMGGAGSALAGGNFWEGATTGGIVAGFNHLAHGEDPPGKKPDSDGKLTLEEANDWYRNGNGEALTVDASKVDLNAIDPSKLSYDKYTPVQTLLDSKDGRIYGNISLKLVKGTTNKVTIYRDQYNFEMHKGNSVKTYFRNFATKVGAYLAGEGKSYYINFRGTNTINYSPPVPRQDMHIYRYGGTF